HARQRGLEGPAGKELTTPAERRAAALRAMSGHDILRRRPCQLIGVDPKTVRRARVPDHPEIRTRMRELAAERRRFGYRRIGLILKPEGVKMKHKKFRQVYSDARVA